MSEYRRTEYHSLMCAPQVAVTRESIAERVRRTVMGSPVGNYPHAWTGKRSSNEWYIVSNRVGSFDEVQHLVASGQRKQFRSPSASNYLVCKLFVKRTGVVYLVLKDAGFCRWTAITFEAYPSFRSMSGFATILIDEAQSYFGVSQTVQLHASIEKGLGALECAYLRAKYPVIGGEPVSSN